MKQVITYEEARNMEKIQLVDVRSPAEYAVASIPGAVNIPLYSDEERHRLGLTYKEEGAETARMQGLEMVSPRLPQLVREIRFSCEGRHPVLYCWRGGARSESVAAILQIIHIPASRLQGGYKAYRRYVFSRLSQYNLKAKPVVLHGLTGVGKTRILHLLQDEGYPVLDLEGLALHRGSVFGSLGLEHRPRSQKDFEALLLESLEKHRESPYLLVEGEGRKIGPVFVPPFLVAAMGEGFHLLLEASLEKRVERIMKEYVQDNPEVISRARESLTHIRKHLGRESFSRIESSLEEGSIRDAVRDLCVNYYDRLYLDSRKDDAFYAAVIPASDMVGAVEGIKGFLDKTFPGGCGRETSGGAANG